MVDGLIKARQRPAARRIMLWLTDHSESKDPKVLSLVARAWADKESTGRITVLRHAHLNRLVQRPLKLKNYERLLYLAARYEALGRAMPVAAGDLIARQMVSDAGRDRLRDASEKALAKAPGSSFLAYINAVTTAKCGNASAAGLALSGQIQQLAQERASNAASPAKTKRRFDVLRAAWRVVDKIARDDMQWLDGAQGKTYATFATSEQQSETDVEADTTLEFSEPLLQARAGDAYLAACRRKFDTAKTLTARLLAIKEMVREGARRRLDYHAEYQMAEQSYDEARGELAEIFAKAKKGDPDNAREVVRAFSFALDLCETLRRTKEARQLKDWLAQLSQLDAFARDRWSILAAIVDEQDAHSVDIARDLRAQIETPPETEADLRSFLRWAMIAREFTDAELVFNALKPSLRSSEAALYFVNILQRQSRFTDAIRLIKDIHAQMLARPAQVKPYIHWNLVRRYGEIEFLRQTARIYRHAPQPTAPEGVVILAARNVDQLRKYPIVVLMEMKRRGWAVIPLVEGLLPRERTGIQQLDVLNGCITLENTMVEGADARLSSIRGFKVDTAKGIARWGDIDLSHSLLEDARISRRAYNIDLTCPALVANLDRLCLSATLFARAINHARKVCKRQRRRVALMSLFNSRMPDSLFREYCDKRGDPDEFFCLHTTNGYENFFRNFQTNVSTRCVIRNVTKYNHVRTASMPIPEHFERYYRKHKRDLDKVLSKIADVASVKRTTGGNSVVDPAAEECKARILDWRAKGGKVACLFGRVVCDSAVPYDGGPAHADLSDWLNHTIEAVRGSDTLLVIKPHPHELNEAIGTYLNEYFADLIKTELPDNVLIMGHKWFDIQSLKEFVDLGLVYNSTAAIELALMELPTVVCGYFTPIDYPVGNIVPRDRKHYEQLVRFEAAISPKPDFRARAAIWLQYMSTSGFVADYRYHARPTTNRVIYPPYWVEEDVIRYNAQGDSQVTLLVDRAIGAAEEPGSQTVRRARGRTRERS